jgi:hypothetical protein
VRLPWVAAAVGAAAAASTALGSETEWKQARGSRKRTLLGDSAPELSTDELVCKTAELILIACAVLGFGK